MQVWVHGDNASNTKALLASLHQSVAESSKDFKAFVIILTSNAAEVEAAKKMAEQAEKDGKTKVGIAHLPITHEAVKAYKVNTAADVKNTVMFYKNRRITANMVNFKADEAGLKKLQAAIAEVQK